VAAGQELEFDASSVGGGAYSIGDVTYDEFVGTPDGVSPESPPQLAVAPTVPHVSISVDAEGAHLQVTGPTVPLAVQSSTDLMHWDVLQYVMPIGNEAIPVDDPSAPTGPGAHFYRAIIAQPN
jgi:hypothetical protein